MYTGQQRSLAKAWAKYLLRSLAFLPTRAPQEEQMTVGESLNLDPDVVNQIKIENAGGGASPEPPPSLDSLHPPAASPYVRSPPGSLPARAGLNEGRGSE